MFYPKYNREYTLTFTNGSIVIVLSISTEFFIWRNQGIFIVEVLYRNDRSVIKITNYLQVLIRSIFAILISMFTVPALSEMFATNAVASSLDFVSDYNPEIGLAESSMMN